MIDKFDPTTNRVQWGLLTEQERNVLTEWQHGIEYYSFGTWVSCGAAPMWYSDTVYRGKPAPKVTSGWFNVYPQGPSNSKHYNRIIRIDTCNGVSTAHLEEL
jgi:hypothetical protein